MHGAHIVAKILGKEEYYEQWKAQLLVVANRIKQMREILRKELERLNTPGTWNHITDQIGMFTYTGLNKKQCEIMINDYHVFMLTNGRISMVLH